MSCNGGANFLNCNDLTSAIIQAILNLKGSAGSEADDIFDEVQNICPGIVTSLADVQAALDTGCSRGIFFRSRTAVGATPTFMVMAYMARYNPPNKVYARYPCQTNGFFKCGVPSSS